MEMTTQPETATESMSKASSGARRSQGTAGGGQVPVPGHNEWISGTHSRSTIHDFFGLGEEQAHRQAYQYDADHPEQLVATDMAPTPCGVPAPRPGRMHHRGDRKHRFGAGHRPDVG
jgi:hypothetical protein